MPISVYPPHPVRIPVMFQRWQSISFLHWRCDVNAIRAMLPSGLEPDLFDGTAWVGLTPFRVVDLHAPYLPPLPWISQFPETNLRTYVYDTRGERGIWFFTLEAARLIAVVGARAFYGLPYRWAEMHVAIEGAVAQYASRRKGPWIRASSRIRVRIGQAVLSDNLATFLTARFRLYTLLYGKLAFADVEHVPWPLQKAEVMQLEEDLTRHAGLEKLQGEPIAHYSEGVDVRIGRPQLQA